MVLGCHLHGSMRGHLFVSEHALGRRHRRQRPRVIADVPDGGAELRTWSPDQLIVQPPVDKQIAGAAMNLDATLNFTPPKARRKRS